MNVYVTSDHHFHHKKFYETHKDKFGKPARPQFESNTEADEYMIERWNSMVKDGDKVYHLGDFSISQKGISIASRLNGRKILILGNHDIFPAKKYLEFFKDVRAYKVFDKMIFSHVPVHPDQLGTRFLMNVHGHVHLEDLNDERYYNVCVERTLWAPVPVEILIDACSFYAGG